MRRGAAQPLPLPQTPTLALTLTLTLTLFLAATPTLARFAAAQHKNLYIYDGTGTELHCLRPNHGHGSPQVIQRLAFLRYHWLLASVGQGGHLRYLDVSTGVCANDSTPTPQSARTPARARRVAGRGPRQGRRQG